MKFLLYLLVGILYSFMFRFFGGDLNNGMPFIIGVLSGLTVDKVID